MKPIFNPGLRWVANSAGQMTSEAQRLLRALLDTTFKRTGSDDASVVTGTAGVDGNVSKWDANGNLVDGGKAEADLLVAGDIGVAVQGYSASLTDIAARWTPASAASASRLDFFEDTDDGSNRVRVTAPTLSADRQFMLPNADVTMPAYIATLLNAGNNAAAQAAVGLVIGTDVQGYSAALADLSARWTAASASGPASLDLREDSDNGTNRVRITVPASLAADRTFTLPDASVIISAFIATLLDDANAAAALATLGVVPGRYTPTLTNSTNIDSSTAFTTNYVQIGDVCIVFGAVTIDATASGSALTTLGMSLPVASNFANAQQLGGVGYERVTSQPVQINADPTNDRAEFNYPSLSVNSRTFYFIFGYQVI